MGPMKATSLRDRGEHMSYTHTTKDGVTDLMAALWVDRNWRYFIASTSTTRPGTPYDRLRWRPGEATAARVALTVL